MSAQVVRMVARFGAAALCCGVVLLLVPGCPLGPVPGACSTNADCDDGNACTLDVCNPATSVCVNDPIACPDGAPGEEAHGFKITDHHGTDYLLSSGEFEEAGKFFTVATITSATAAADGTVTVNFTVEDEDGSPVVGLTSVNGTIVKLQPAGGGESFNKWVPYIYRTQTVEGSADGDWPNPDGTTAYQGYRENTGTLINHGDGSYTYVFDTNIAGVTVDGTPIAYDRSLTHRVSVTFGGHEGATGDATFDFVPNGSALTETRNIVETDTCKQCHGFEFHGHGGDRLRVETCVTCHVPGNIDPQGGETVDFKVMIHKIHAGGEVASLPGPDGILWDNPNTAEDETADNGEYAIWGYRDTKHEWWKVGFPAVIENCTKCHQGSGAQVDNWKEVPSRAVCGSCHDDVDFATGTNHGGGAQPNDSACTTCHTTGGFAPSVTEAHDWTTKDERNIPEFDVELTVSAPANGMYFVAGETPVVTLRLTDVETGNLIDHTTAFQDPAREGCESSPCPPRDGLFDRIYLFVHGPRAKRVPVLTTTARVEVVSTAGPWDLSAADATLDLTVDAGRDLLMKDPGGRAAERVSGTISVDVADGTFANVAAATAGEVVAWLNADSAFAARAIAYLEGGRVAIRSRNLGTFFALQLQPSEVTTQVFGGDTNVKVIGGTYPSNAIYRHTDPAEDDPKARWFTDRIEYTLDPVDDLEPGTYLATVELGDRGRINNSNYKTPSVAKTPFQVGMADEEPAVARNCGSCHQGPDGTGFILDFARHYKIFDNTAVDQCGACHDYQPREAAGASWEGARPIAKRVHAVHFGSSLNYPNTTVDYTADPVTGRSWDITFPQDVRNCQACHPDDTSSGTWATKPARVPCSGCHDSPEATAHMGAMTWDLTPENPFSGDEEESCKVCH